MARNDDPFMRHLVTKHGTGLASRADASGNHQLSQSLIDSYSQAGRTIPANLQPAIRELNDLTQREVMLAKTTPEARRALGGSGYDPVAVRARYRELENALYEQSADVRNLGERLNLQQKEQQVRSLELANTYTEQLQPNKVRAENAGLLVQAMQSEMGAQDLEKVQQIRQFQQQAEERGVTLNDMYDAWDSRDPALMKDIFGTADQTVAHQMILSRSAMQDEVSQRQTATMAEGVTLSAARLAMNADVSDSDLQMMASGELETPNGESRFAVAKAMEERTGLMQARIALMEAEAQGMTAGQEYKQLVLSDMSPMQMSRALEQMAAGSDDVTGEELMSAVMNGRAADVAELASRVMQAQGSDGMIEVQTSTGSKVRVPVNDVVQHMIERTQDRAGQTAMQLVNMQSAQNFIKEQQAVEREIQVTQAIVGFPLPQQITSVVEGYKLQANLLMQAMIVEPDPAKKAQMQTAAAGLMQQARDTVAESAARYGASPLLVEDLKQGRFHAQASHKEALVAAVSFDQASLRTSPFGNAFADLIRDKDLSPRTLAQWAANPEANLTDLGITPAEIFGVIDNMNFQVLSASVLETVQEDPRFHNMRDVLAENLEPLLERQASDSDKLAPSQVLERVLTIARTMDEVAYMQDVEATRAAGQPPTYQRGALQQAIRDHILQRGVLEQALAPNGAPSREMAALMGEVLHLSRPDVGIHGETSTQFVDMPAAVANLSLQRLANSFAGQSAASLAGVRAVAIKDATRILAQNSGGFAEGGLAAATEDYRMRISAVETAVMGVFARKLADPGRYRSRIGGQVFGVGLPSIGMSDVVGTGVPSAGFVNAIATTEEVQAELTRLGYDPNHILRGAQ